MIFVSVGLNQYAFDRLLGKMDEIAPELGEEVVMQTGFSEFKGKNTECFQYGSDAEMAKYYDKCSVLVCHAGVGTLINGMKRNIPVVMVPRRAMYHEVDTDHQLMIAKKVMGMGRGVQVLDVEGLREAIAEARTLKFPPYVQDTSLVDYMSGLLKEREGKPRYSH